MLWTFFFLQSSTICISKYKMYNTPHIPQNKSWYIINIKMFCLNIWVVSQSWLYHITTCGHYFAKHQFALSVFDHPTPSNSLVLGFPFFLADPGFHSQRKMPEYCKQSCTFHHVYFTWPTHALLEFYTPGCRSNKIL